MSDPAPDPYENLGTDEPRATESPIVRDDDPTTASDPRRSTRTGRRAGSRVALGIAIGPLAGALLGVLIGSLVFGAGSRGFWAAVVAGAIFGALGGFWGGLSGLGPPDVENDPLPPATPDDRDERPGSGGSRAVG
jgi:hypothetical protein